MLFRNVDDRRYACKVFGCDLAGNGIESEVGKDRKEEKKKRKRKAESRKLIGFQRIRL